MKQTAKYRTVIIRTFLAVISFSIMQSCVKKADFDFNKTAQTNWNPNVSVPLVHSALGLNNIMNIVDTGTFTIDSTHFVTLVYKGQIFSVYGIDFLPLINQTDNESISLTSSEISTLTSYDSVAATPLNIDYPFGVANGEHIDSMTLRNGSLNVHIASFITQSGVLNVSMPTAKLNGYPFSTDISFTFNGNVPLNIGGSFDLSGYDVDMSSLGSFNVLPIVYTVKFTYSNSYMTPTTSETFSITSDFDSLAIKKVFGNFGSRAIQISNDSSRISIFNHALGGNVFFNDPQVEFFINNSFGITIGANFSSLFAYGSVSGIAPITPLPNPIPIRTPTVAGQTADTNFTLNKSNSNIQTVMQNQPNYIGYNVNAQTNVGGFTNDFLEDSSQFKVDVRVDLPLNGYASDFVVQDTAAFTLQNIKQIEWVKFRLNITNGFPIDANTQVYFLDSANKVLDSLISSLEQVVNAGIININTGIVTTPTHKTTDELFPLERLQNIYDAKKVLIRAVMNSYQYQAHYNVKIYSDYILDVRIGVQAQLNFNLK